MRSLPLLGDRYRLGPIIGTGGMGAVHRAYDERFGREVAVKVVRSGADAVEQERLRREAQYLAGLDHPNLVAVYDLGWDHTPAGETVWFAMELIEGPDLRRVLREDGPLSTADAARVLEGAAGALQVLHAAGVVHRDLKPANVLLTASPASGRWEMKLADLGIAQLLLAEQLTSTGQIIGTAAYLSPEQVSGRRIGPASDVYALGLLLIEALTGRIAFPGNAVESAAARLVRSPEVPRELEPAWRALLTEMTARDPAARPGTAEVERRARALPRSARRAAIAEATAVLPAASVAAEDVPTEALALHRTQPIALPVDDLRTTGWTPSLRPRRRAPRKRRILLGAASLVTATALAGGGAAVLGGTSTGDTVSAAPARVASAAPSHRSSSPPAPHVSRSARPAAVKAAAAPAPSTVAQDAAVQQQADQSSRAAQRHAWTELRRLQRYLRDRLRQNG